MEPAPTSVLPRTSSRRRLIAAAILFVAVALTVVGRQVYAARTAKGPTEYELSRDFRDAAYYPARAVLHGHDPYDVKDYLRRYPVEQEFPLYSPGFVLLNMPWSLLPYRVAAVLAWIANLALTVVVARLALRRARLPDDWPLTLLLAVALLASVAGLLSLVFGQATLLVILGVQLALAETRRRR